MADASSDPFLNALNAPTEDDDFLKALNSGIDPTRPVLNNADGSFSTERTITVEADGRHYVIPTIVGGKERGEDEAIDLWKKGSNREVGVFPTAEEADKYAVSRSEQIGKIRQPVEDPFLQQLNAETAAKRQQQYDEGVQIQDDERTEETRKAGEIYLGDEKISTISKYAGGIATWLSDNPVVLDSLLDIAKGDVSGVLANVAEAGADVVTEIATSDKGAAEVIKDELAEATELKLPETKRVEFRRSELADTTGVMRGDVLKDYMKRQQQQLELSHRQTMDFMYELKLGDLDPGGQDPFSIVAAQARNAAVKNREAIDALKTEMGPEPDYDQSWLEQVGMDAIQLYSTSLPPLVARLATQGAAAGVGAGIGLLGGPAGPRAGLAAGWKYGKYLGDGAAAVVSFDILTGSINEEFKQIRDDAGNPLDPEVRQGAVLVAGMLVSGIEVAQGKTALKGLGPLGDALNKGDMGGVKKALQDQATQGLLKSIAKRVASNAGLETTQEVAQEMVQILTGHTAQTLSAGAPQNFDVGTTAQRLTETGVKTATGLAPGGVAKGMFQLGTHGVVNFIEASKRKQELANTEKVNAIVDMTDGPAAQQIPQPLAHMINKAMAADGGTVHTLFSDPVAMSQAASELGIKLADVLPDAEKRMARANESRVEVDGATATFEISLEEFTALPQKLKEALRHNTAVKLGERTAQELAYTIEREKAQQVASVVAEESSAEKTKKAQAATTPANIAELKAYHDSLEMEQRAAAYYTDRNTGAFQPRGEAITPDPERPNVARISLEAKKHVNDKYTHEAVDGALRIIAQTAAAKGIKVVTKRGGSVEINHKDAAELAAVVQAASSALGGEIGLHVTSMARGATIEETLQQLGPLHDKREDEKISKGELSKREDMPVGFKGDKVLMAQRAAEWAAAAHGDAPLAVQLSPEQLIEFMRLEEQAGGQIFFDTYHDQTGLLNELGMKRVGQALEAQGKPVVWVSGDARGIKVMDQTYGGAKADFIMDVLSKVFLQNGAGKVNFARLHGDEYGAVTTDEAAVDALFADVAEALRTILFVGQGKDGRFYVLEGLHFAHGKAKTFTLADSKELPAAKDKQGAVAKPKPFPTRAAADAELKRIEKRRRGERLIRVDLDQATESALSSGSRRQREAREGLSVQTPLPTLVAEWRKLGDELKVESPFEAIKEMVAEEVAERSAARLGATHYLRLEAILIEHAQRMLGEGNKIQAYRALQKAIGHRIRFSEVLKAAGDRDAFKAQLKGLRKSSLNLAKAGPVFQSLGEWIQEKVEGRDLDPDTARIPLGDALREFEGTDEGAGIDGQRFLETLDKIIEGDWKKLPVKDLRYLSGALTQLQTVADNMNRVVADDGSLSDFETFRDKVEYEASRRPQSIPPDGMWFPRRFARSFAASNREVQRVMANVSRTLYSHVEGYRLEGMKVLHQLYKTSGKQFVDAWDEFKKANGPKLDEVLKDLDGVPWSPDYDRVPIFNRKWMLMIAFQMGTRSGRDRMLKGYNWNETEVIEWLKRNMTKAEAKFVQDMWNLLGDLGPKMFETARRETGKTPTKVEAIELNLGDKGVLRGGYFPIKFDPVLSRKSSRQKDADMERMRQRNPIGHSMAHSFTEERAEDFTDVVSLEWRSLPNHINDVIHYIAFNDFRRQADRIFKSQTIESAIRRTYGQEYLNKITDPDNGYISRAVDRHHNRPEGFEAGLDALGAYAAFQYLGGNLPTILADIVTPLSDAALGVVQPGPLLRGNLRFFSKKHAEIRKDALANSSLLQQMADNERRKTQNALAKIDKNIVGEVAAIAMETMVWFQERVSLLVGTSLWNAEVQRQIDEGVTDGATLDRVASEAVARSIPNYMDPVSRAPMFSEKGWKYFVIFMGFFNKNYNKIADRLDPLMQEWQFAEGFKEKLYVATNGNMAFTAGALLAYLVVQGVFAGAIMNKLPEDDEEPEQWMLRRAVAEGMGLAPITNQFGDMAGQALAEMLFDNDVNYQRSHSPRGLLPIMAVWDAIDHLRKASDEKESDFVRVWEMIDTVLPNYPARTMRYGTSDYGLEKDLSNGDWLDIPPNAYKGFRGEKPPQKR